MKAAADKVWELASRGALLQGGIEAQSKALERFVESGSALRAEITRTMGAAATSDLAAYDAAYEKDHQAGRDLIATREQEAAACAEAFGEACAALVKFLENKPACSDLLQDL